MFENVLRFDHADSDEEKSGLEVFCNELKQAGFGAAPVRIDLASFHECTRARWATASLVNALFQRSDSREFAAPTCRWCKERKGQTKKAARGLQDRCRGGEFRTWVTVSKTRGGCQGHSQL